MISLLFICAILIACGDLLMGYVDALSNEPSHDKAAIKREKCDACISTIEREQARPKVNKKIEGELFK